MSRAFFPSFTMFDMVTDSYRTTVDYGSGTGEANKIQVQVEEYWHDRNMNERLRHHLLNHKILSISRVRTNMFGIHVLPTGIRCATGSCFYF